MLGPLPRFAWASPVVVVGLVAGWMRGRGGFLFGLGAPRGVGPLFSVSGVGAGVFGCGLVLLPSLALFVGLHLDFGLKKVYYTL